MNNFSLQDKVRMIPDNDWMIGIAFLIIMLYVLNRLLFPRYHNRISYAFFNRYEASKLLEERSELFHRSGLMLNFVSVFCIAILVFIQVGWFRDVTLFDHPFHRYLAILLITFTFFGFRILLVSFFGYLLNRTEISLRFNQIWLFHFQNLGSYMLIPALGLPFVTGQTRFILLIAIWVLLGLWWVFTLYRQVQLLSNSHISLFYLILYLCTLEILPLWWAIKTIAEGWRG